MKCSFSHVTALTFVALITIASAQQPMNSVTLIESNKVAAAFAKGRPMLETGEFKIQAGRRDGPGIAEVHARDTDIFHFLEGSATFVTGGTATEPKTIAPDEIRGKEIHGGESHRVSKGDVIV